MKIEELIQLKKNEKPTQADWAKFDVQLKRKMLLSIVKKEPLYARILHELKSARSFKIGVTFAAAACVVSVFYLNFNAAKHSSENLNSAFEKASSQPKGSSTFAVNEFLVNTPEIPVNSQINATESMRTRYISSAPEGLKTFAF